MITITKEELRPEIDRLKNGPCADSAVFFSEDKTMLENLIFHTGLRIQTLQNLLGTIETDYWGLREGEGLDRSQQGVVDAFSSKLAWNYATREVYEEALKKLRGA